MRLYKNKYRKKIKKYIDFYNEKSYYVLIEIKKYEI